MMKRHFLNPTAWFGVFLCLSTITGFALTSADYDRIKLVVSLEGIALQLIASAWVLRDSKLKGRMWPSDHAYTMTALFFPIYVISTRGWKGVALIFGVLFLLAFTALAPVVIIF